MSRLDGHRRLMLTVPALAFAGAGLDTVILRQLGAASVSPGPGLSPNAVILGLMGSFMVALAAVVAVGWLMLRPAAPGAMRHPAGSQGAA